MNRWPQVARPALLVACAFTVAACDGTQSALDPTGDNATRIAWLFWLFNGVSVAVWLAVMGVMGVALLRRRSRESVAAEREATSERRMGVAVGAASAATVLTLIVLTVSSYFTTRGFGAVPDDALHITVTGKQWWWHAEYKDADPSRAFTTANELHLLVGRPVTLTLMSTDVIHSFWVPNLAGKQDLIPGRVNLLTFTPEQTGVYRGQCAEFCGLQHAHMALVVVVEEQQAFDEWRAREQADAQPPEQSESAEGLGVFVRNGCAACHTVRGTEAAGRLGPDLTHIASRQTIAAGTLPNSRGNLQGWIADPQGIKPGAKMPRLDLSAAELNAVTDFLAGLK